MAHASLGRQTGRGEPISAPSISAGPGGADLINANGLVRQGGTLEVVRNSSRIPTTLHLTADGCSVTLRTQHATDLDRVLTTAATPRGRALFVDSKFDEPLTSGPSEVINDPVSR